jgi:Leucine-rich repeat (LRR) protein
LPDRVGGMTRLRTLDLGHNRLTEVPETLGEIEGLSDFL